MLCPCVYYSLCLARRVSFSATSSGVITNHMRSAKDIDSHFKSRLYAEDLCPKFVVDDPTVLTSRGPVDMRREVLPVSGGS